MSARAVADVRGEQRRVAAAAAASRQQQRRPRHGGSGGESGPGAGPATTTPPAAAATATTTTTSAAMATVGERRSLPSPEAMLGQPWSHWVDAAKLHGNDGEQRTLRVGLAGGERDLAGGGSSSRQGVNPAGRLRSREALQQPASLPQVSGKGIGP